MNKKEWTTLARVERDFTNGVTLQLIRDDETVEVHEGDEFFIVKTSVDPFKGGVESDVPRS